MMSTRLSHTGPPAADPGKRFTAVIVTWNSATDVSALIESVERHLGECCELLFVDNASSDRTVSEIRELSPRSNVIVLEKNIGFGPANNIGVREATTDVVVLLNPDTVMVDRSLVDLVAAAETERAIFAPRLLNVDGSPQISARPALGSWQSALISIWPGALMPARVRQQCEPWRFDTRLPAGWISGACLAAQRTLLLDLGPFDERLPMYGEDADLSMRAWQVGVASISAPDLARVVHIGGRSASQAYCDTGIRSKIEVRWWLANEHLGRVRANLDLAAEFVLYGTRWAAKSVLRRSAATERHWLRSAVQVVRAGRPNAPRTLPPDMPPDGP